MIVRRGKNEIEFREFAQWGEPLDLGIGRVLREELVARGAASAVQGAGMRRFFLVPVVLQWVEHVLEGSRHGDG